MEYPYLRNEGHSLEAPSQWYRSSGPDTNRKRLGQYFTSMPVARLLAHLALNEQIRSVLDPMCGDGNLLAATAEAAVERGFTLGRLDGIELDPLMSRRCKERLSILPSRHSACSFSVIEGNAFEVVGRGGLPLIQYDLVITNPPYVRYQALTRACESTSSPNAREIRSQLVKTCSAMAGNFWVTLATGYSGLADLSVPAWLLSATLVAPGGMLALVVPATWRSREYADVLRYLMMSAFDIELIVEDTQPGWFSDALVRTHLVIARRHAVPDIQPLGAQQRPPRLVKWLTVGPSAATAESVVGGAFPGAVPERELVGWLASHTHGEAPGVSLRSTPESRDLTWLQSHSSRRKWYVSLEGSQHDAEPHPNFGMVPDVLADTVGLHDRSLLALGEIPGLSIGQGLRTGCNGFFYVESLGNSDNGGSELFVSVLFPNQVFEAPTSVLRPVLRRQSELSAYAAGDNLSGRLLDLRGWVLDEDTEDLSYNGMRHLRLLPSSLANYVRLAAQKRLVEDDESTRIPLLSAVRTNIRISQQTDPPRFWYTIPDLVNRHIPDLFVPRVANHSPETYPNRDKQLIIDANFSTLAVQSPHWTTAALLAFLRSTWSKGCMELLGTRMGGGALKLEAAQLRKLPVPPVTAAQLCRLHELGSDFTRNDTLNEIDRIVLRALFISSGAIDSAGEKLHRLVKRLSADRRNR